MKKSLKTLAVLICAAFALCFTQCTKSPEDLIIGTWNMEDVEITESYGDQSVTEHNGPEENETVVITFNKDNTMTQVVTTVEDGITYTHTKRGTYTLVDNNLSFVLSGPQTYDIETLDKHDMILSTSESGMIDGILHTTIGKVYLKRL